jgi:hypothetical protein
MQTGLEGAGRSGFLEGATGRLRCAGLRPVASFARPLWGGGPEGPRALARSCLAEAVCCGASPLRRSNKHKLSSGQVSHA